MSVAFETERLVAYRSWLPDHAEAAFAIYGDPEVVRFIGNQRVPDMAAMQLRLEQLAAKYAAYEGRFLGAFPVAKKSTGLVVATALLKFLPRMESDGTLVDTADLEAGWHLSRSVWGMGYATEIGHALLALAFVHHPVSVVHAVVEPENQRSQAVARRIGMEYVGRTSSYYGRELEHFISRAPTDDGLPL